MLRSKQTARGKTVNARQRRSSGYDCGDETRDRLIESALELFSRHGFEGASTRAIAAHAGTTTPGLQYYFTNKEGLYVACIARMCELLWRGMQAEVQSAQMAIANNLADTVLIDTLVAIQAKLTELALTSKEAASAHMILSQQQSGLGPPVGYRMMYQQLIEPIFDLHFAIIGRLLNLPANHEETALRALSMHGLGIGFLTERRSTLQLLGWKRYDAEHIQRIVGVVSRQIRCCLLDMLASRAEPTPP